MVNGWVIIHIRICFSFPSWWGRDGLSGQREKTTLPTVLLLGQWAGMNGPSRWHYHSWSLRSSVWDKNDPQLWTNPEQQWTWGILPFSSTPLFFTSPVHFSIYLFIYLFNTFLWIPFLEWTWRQNDPLILHWIPRRSELWCDRLLCNVPLMTGASPLACCALMCVGPAKLTSDQVRQQLMHF